MILYKQNIFKGKGIKFIGWLVKDRYVVLTSEVNDKIYLFNE